ncbi:hypothetical protein EUX98_g4735 [Antrodiella citrinella]|uniref:Uncharacterized protein n=1 Tax=Antrodiella citrinella TaxID=2447956 RepID=A0A4S4N173_9APHY|nr:hypothetical protein EUX98_g4735 [Antrodiella citrinella]
MMRDDTESKDHVLESILRMRRDANDVNSAFKSINDELLRIIHNVKRHPDFVSKVGKLQKEWEEHYNTFKETLWRSREIAGSAQALIAGQLDECLCDLFDSSCHTVPDFVDVYLPLLLNSTVADETKAKELEVYVKMADSNVQATDVTRSFAELTSAVQLCAYRWRELQIKAKKYTKSDRIAEKVITLAKVPIRADF